MQCNLVDGLKQGGQLFFHDSRLFHIFFLVVAFQLHFEHLNQEDTAEYQRKQRDGHKTYEKFPFKRFSDKVPHGDSSLPDQFRPQRQDLILMRAGPFEIKIHDLHVFTGRFHL